MVSHDCKWLDCGEQFKTSLALASHVRSSHVNPANSELAVCLWEGCRVYNQPSINPTWLARHVIATHTKEKPFKCLIEACAASFATRDGLARHMPMHFGNSSTNTSPSGSNGGATKTNSVPKSRHRVRAGVQYVQQSVHARQWRWGYVDRLVKCPGSDGSMTVRAAASFSDPFDGDAMDKIRNAAVEAELEDLGIKVFETSSQGGASATGDAPAETIKLTGEVRARRTGSDSDAATVLISWTPVGLSADEWMPESSLPYTKTIPKPKQDVLSSPKVSHRKHRRKACKPY